MTDQELRSKLVRLAHSKPELRQHILPLLKSAGTEKAAAMTATLALPIKEAAILLVKTLTGRATPVAAMGSFKVVLQTCSMFAKRGVRDPMLFALLVKAEKRLTEIIEAQGTSGMEDLMDDPYHRSFDARMNDQEWQDS
jgi:hypothetical protein